MFLFSINASSERNRDRLCKTMRKIFHYKSRTSDRRVETNKSRVDINSSRLEIEVTLFKKLFWLWCSRKEWSESFIFFWGGRRLENPAAKESSDLFGLPAPFCCILSTLVGSPWISWRKGQVNFKLFSGMLCWLFLKKEIRSPSVHAYAYCCLLIWRYRTCIWTDRYVRQYLSTNSKSLFVPFDLQFYHLYFELVYAKVLRLLNLSDVCLNNSG